MAGAFPGLTSFYSTSLGTGFSPNKINISNSDLAGAPFDYAQGKLLAQKDQNLSCDLAGARTQDPLLKREMLYQLSYQIRFFKRTTENQEIFFSDLAGAPFDYAQGKLLAQKDQNLSCDLAGARTQDPLLKREMLYQLSYQICICAFANAGANILSLIYFSRTN